MRQRTPWLCSILVSLVMTSHMYGAQPFGPTPYKSFADSPFKSINFEVFYLEDFEDHLLNVPGVTPSAGIVTSTQFAAFLRDSVDGDDGDPTNGSCFGCDSFFFGSGATGIRFTFNSSVLGGLPTHAGIVWTDGVGTTSFEAFDATGASLGVVGPVAIADGSFEGTTGEDHFFGFSHDGGISSIKISNTLGGIEVDHLQYGLATTCTDADEDGFGFPGDPMCRNGAAEDCNDQDPRISPSEPEIYDGRDNNCDGSIDEGLDEDLDGIPDFRDLCLGTPSGFGVAPDGCAVCEIDGDGDGFGATQDCDDGDASVYPGAMEICNSRDDDCDGVIDEGFDKDGDGFKTCQNDCDDSNPRVNPAAVELPGNLVDENCDGSLGTCDPGTAWANHGEFVGCVARECGALVASGALTQGECGSLIGRAAKTRVGSP